MNARITVMECSNDSRLDLLMFGRWYWQASVPGRGSARGNARTEERARTKAEAAARKLSAKPTTKFEQYNLPLDT
ncbi:hypothetical protein [Streptomyces sp. NPDC013457]|uniref:hypothetical protein n=1 Tax=Streptomyces sp. NPDC013457 TaxID=3364866 RepID=UPI0037016E96